jgi:hypothetical protein
MAPSGVCHEEVFGTCIEYGGIREQEQYGNNLRRKASQMILNR